MFLLFPGTVSLVLAWADSNTTLAVVGAVLVVLAGLALMVMRSKEAMKSAGQMFLGLVVLLGIGLSVNAGFDHMSPGREPVECARGGGPLALC